MIQRYFLEVSYRGTNYSGFQKQANANTIQEEIEKAFAVIQKVPIELTGSSRTDAGVHALQNFFHFDYNGLVHPQFAYKINSVLPEDIVVKNILPVSNTAHCRFDAIGRSYKYYIYHRKDPFIRDRAYYYPYTLDLQKLNEVAGLITQYQDFTTFSKRNTQVKTFECVIENSEWTIEANQLVYHVKSNRFLRGMVRGLTGTMLQVGRNKISMEAMRLIIEGRDCSRADFSVPAKGLFLVSVEYRANIFD
ncbi:MAG: tRNA pseudouridine(38-40) synthase TruA [Chitinophagaceae bacterium]